MVIKNSNGIDLHHLVHYGGERALESVDYSPQVVHPGVNRQRTDDVYEHACNITAWQQLYDQLQPGRFNGELAEVWLEGVQFFQEYTNMALRQSCMVWPEALWIGLPLEGRQEGYIGFQPIHSHSIALRQGGMEFELNTPDNYTIMGIVVDLQLLGQYPELLQEDEDRLQQLMHCESLQVSLQQKRHLTHFIQSALSIGEVEPSSIKDPAVRKVMRHNMLDSILALLLSSHQGKMQISRSRINYQRLITQVREYILAYRDEVITVVDLCQHLHVSRRTLQNCFQQQLGVSPIQYLKAIRLNAVRRELESSYSQYQTVQDAAVAWGFWHMSQFAVDYQRMFGEKPSDSLAVRGRLMRI